MLRQLTCGLRCLALLGLGLVVPATSSAAAAVWLAPGEPLAEAHLRRLVATALPPGEHFELVFSRPALPLHNPATSEAFLELVDFRLEPRSERFTGAFRVELDTGETRVLGLAGRASAMVEVLVPVRAVAAGERLNAGLLEPLIVAERRLRADTLTDPAALTDLEAKRRLLPGRPLRRADVQAVRLVRRGETVEVVYRTAGIEIVTLARTLEDGSHGSRVTLANLESGQRVSGRVTRAGQVAVDAAPGAPR